MNEEAEDRLRVAAADAGDEVEEALRPARAGHPREHLRRGVLQREVVVRRDRAAGRHRLEELRLQLGGLQVEQADTLQALDGVEHRDEVALGVATPLQVLAPARGVLADADQLAHAAGDQPAGLGLQLPQRPRGEPAAVGRDRAERAHAVAAAGDLEVGPDAARRGAHGERGVRRCLRSGPGCGPRQHRQGTARRCLRRRATSQRGGHELRQTRVGVEPVDARHLRQRLGQLRPVALGHATDDEDGDRPPLTARRVRRLEDRVDGLRARLLDERAGVDQHAVGVGDVVGDLQTGRDQRARDLVGVDLVAAAAQGDDRDPRGGGGLRHRAPSRSPGRSRRAPRRPGPACPPPRPVARRPTARRRRRRRSPRGPVRP